MKQKKNIIGTDNEEQKLLDDRTVYYMQNREEIIQRRIVVTVIFLFVLLVVFVFYRNGQINNNSQPENLISTEVTTTTVTQSVTEATEVTTLEQTQEASVNEYENVLLCWGDSFSENNDNSMGFYGYHIFEKLVDEGCDSVKGVYSAGAASESLLSLNAKFGGYNMETDSFVIPSEAEPVEIKVKSTYDRSDIVLDKYNNPGLNPCEICGVQGNITFDGEKTYFKRLQPGDAVQVPDRSVVASNLMTEMKDYISVFFFGNIYNSTPDEAVELYNSIIENSNERYVIVGPVVGTKKDIEPYDRAFEQAFGSHYINFREYMCLNAFDDYTVNITAGDLESLKADNFPKGFMLNELRLNDKVASILGDVIYNKLQELKII